MRLVVRSFLSLAARVLEGDNNFAVVIREAGRTTSQSSNFLPIGTTDVLFAVLPTKMPLVSVSSLLIARTISPLLFTCNLG